MVLRTGPTLMRASRNVGERLRLLKCCRVVRSFDVSDRGRMMTGRHTSNDEGADDDGSREPRDSRSKRRVE